MWKTKKCRMYSWYRESGKWKNAVVLDRRPTFVTWRFQNPEIPEVVQFLASHGKAAGRGWSRRFGMQAIPEAEKNGLSCLSKIRLKTCLWQHVRNTSKHPKPYSNRWKNKSWVWFLFKSGATKALHCRLLTIGRSLFDSVHLSHAPHVWKYMHDYKLFF